MIRDTDVFKNNMVQTAILPQPPTFEDGIELCISEAEEAATKEQALNKMKNILAILKENKFNEIKQTLGVLSS